MLQEEKVSNTMPKLTAASLLISLVAFSLYMVTITAKILCEIGTATVYVGYGLFQYCDNVTSGTSFCKEYPSYTFDSK